MSVKEKNLKSLIHAAWRETLNLFQDIDVESDQGSINSARSAVWISSLGKQFRDQYKSKDDRVFWKGNPREMLFDLSVCVPLLNL